MINKIKKALHEGGNKLFLERAAKFLSVRFLVMVNKLLRLDGSHPKFKDVLFINGCYLDHPTRYRVTHQMEQMKFFDMSSDCVFHTDLTLDHSYFYRAFIFYRCTHTKFLQQFVEHAQENNKVCFFDIDDLIFQDNYVSTIEYVEQMQQPEYDKYMLHVSNLGRMAKLCDYSITTTSVLARELSKITKEVHINHNVASMEMLHLSNEALTKRVQRLPGDKNIKIGYLSGSITHNPDIRLIEDALVKVANNNSNVRIVLVGEIEATANLRSIGDQLILKEFVSWRDLPQALSLLDINVVPVEISMFNEAKSENKWTEAALVKVPTVATKMGVYTEVINNGITGYLCETHNEWTETLQMLVDNEQLREQVGENAYNYVQDNYTTQKSGGALVEFIRNKLNPLHVFVVPNVIMSGGMRVIITHSWMLKKAGKDVLLYSDDFVTSHLVNAGFSKIPTISSKETKLVAKIDEMTATLWTTVQKVLTQRNVSIRSYFVQNYEVDFYEADEAEKKMTASSTYMYGSELKYKTISHWCVDWLKSLYKIDAQYVPNGINLAEFSNVDRVLNIEKSVINVLIEGDSQDVYKNVDESMRIVSRLKEKYGNSIVCHYVSYRNKPKDHYPVDCVYSEVPFRKMPAIYRYCDVLIKSSKLESFSYPPLEMMATAGYVIVAKNGGNAEYVSHEENCMVYTVGQELEAVEYFDRILSDDLLREQLRAGAIKTVSSRCWGDLEADIIKLWGC